MYSTDKIMRKYSKQRKSCMEKSRVVAGRVENSIDLLVVPVKTVRYHRNSA